MRTHRPAKKKPIQEPNEREDPRPQECPGSLWSQKAKQGQCPQKPSGASFTWQLRPFCVRAVTRTPPTLSSGHPHSVPWKTVAEGLGNRHPCERWILDPDPGHSAWFSKCGPRPAASASLGNPLQMQILGPSQPQCIKHTGWDPDICAYAPTQVSPGWLAGCLHLRSGLHKSQQPAPNSNCHTPSDFTQSPNKHVF